MTDTQSEQHRAACEARMVAAWPIARRTKFILAVHEKRGTDASLKLASDVAALLRKSA